MFCFLNTKVKAFFQAAQCYFVHECFKCSVSALLSFQWCGCWFWLEWCFIKCSTFLFCRHFCTSGIPTASFCGTFFQHCQCQRNSEQCGARCKHCYCTMDGRKRSLVKWVRRETLCRRGLDNGERWHWGGEKMSGLTSNVQWGYIAQKSSGLNQSTLQTQNPSACISSLCHQVESRQCFYTCIRSMGDFMSEDNERKAGFHSQHTET